jgi:hypothetical protein
MTAGARIFNTVGGIDPYMRMDFVQPCNFQHRNHSSIAIVSPARLRIENDGTPGFNPSEFRHDHIAAAAGHPNFDGFTVLH